MRSFAERLRLPGRDHRLVLALRAQLGNLDVGERVLCERVKPIAASGDAGGD